MLVTRETDYALRVLRALAQGGSYTAKELSSRELLPKEFTYKILKKLEKASLIQVTRGAAGGCCLACDLRRVSLYDLVEAVENKARLTCCMDSGFTCDWRQCHGGMCRIHTQLETVQEAIDRELKSRSLYWVICGDGEDTKS